MDILKIFKQNDALLQGHFRLTSGKHSEQYMQCAQVLQHPEIASQLGEELAKHWKSYKIQTVVGPATGGIIVAHEVARALGVRALFTERENGIMTLRRGFTLTPGEIVLVVEDVITTGGSVNEVLSVVREQGAIPVGVGVLVNRSGGKASFDVPLFVSLLDLDIKTYEAHQCPLCLKGIPCIKPGSRNI